MSEFDPNCSEGTAVRGMFGGYTPPRVPTKPKEWPLYNGHLSLTCAGGQLSSIACPACLAIELSEDAPLVKGELDELFKSS